MLNQCRKYLWLSYNVNCNCKQVAKPAVWFRNASKLESKNNARQEDVRLCIRKTLSVQQPHRWKMHTAVKILFQLYYKLSRKNLKAWWYTWRQIYHTISDSLLVWSHRCQPFCAWVEYVFRCQQSCTCLGMLTMATDKKIAIQKCVLCARARARVWVCVFVSLELCKCNHLTEFRYKKTGDWGKKMKATKK